MRSPLRALESQAPLLEHAKTRLLGRARRRDTHARGHLQIWKVSGNGAKGDCEHQRLNGDGGEAACDSHHAGLDALKEMSVALTTVVLAIVGPPLVLWVCWLLSTSASRDAGEQHAIEQLASGDELPLRHNNCARDAMH